MPKLVHISDIHFGPTFDVETWKNVRKEIEGFQPDILVVSGDLVDHPWPFRLLAVKSELEDLCANCVSKPQLFVVPGNHDVRLWGNVRVRLWPGWLERLVLPAWFERIMFNDTTTAKHIIEEDMLIKLGLNEDCRRLTWRRWLKRLKLANAIRLNVSNNRCDGRLQSCDRRRGDGLWPTESEYSQIAITCFDSNPSTGRRLAFATGEVAADQMTRLGRQRHSVRPAGCPRCATSPAATPATASAIILRVAVLHHHPMPIALAAASLKKKSQQGELEPFLVLRNSGDVLQELQRHKFDLVLHGHRHKPQFARLELNADGRDPYPLTVLAAGSTAKRDEEMADNTLRLISTEPNGRMTVDTIESGQPDDTEDPYREDLTHVKQRAFSRARERTKRLCNLIRWETKIDVVGNMRNISEVRKLRLLRGAEPVDGLPVGIAIPPHGQHFDELIQLDDDCRDHMQVYWRAKDGRLHNLNAVPEDGEGCCWFRLNQRLEPGSRPFSYCIRTAASNSIAMNSWELAERSRISEGDPNHESIWRYVSHPADRLTMRLELPPELADTRPVLRCLRPRLYPDFPNTFVPDVVRTFDYHGFVVDTDLQAEEEHNLRYEPWNQAWCLEVEHPVPGYIYEMRWKVPVAIAGDWEIGRTRDYQTMLLEFRDRLARDTMEDKLSDADRQCCDLFNDLARTLMNEFASANPSERQAVFLMVYDRRDLHLYPVLSRLPPDVEAPPSLKVPLGGGVAGAAFLQRSVLAWGKDPDSDTLIRPVPLPGLDAQYILALPIFYRRRGGRLVFDPGAVIGVVTVASDAQGSHIGRCRGDGEGPKKRRDEVQLAAQAVVTEILERLSVRPDADVEPVVVT
jgi:predicted MPP superfamily phosphohydrolase